MNRLIAAVSLGMPAILTLSGCVTANIAGTEIGGTVPMAGITRQQAAEMARLHCAKYGRSARILAIRTEDGAKAIFECTPSGSVRRSDSGAASP
jgi:hypothetical protein